MGPSGPQALPALVGQLEDQLRAAEGHPSRTTLRAPGSEFSFGGRRRAPEGGPSLEERPSAPEMLLFPQSCVEATREPGGAPEEHEEASRGEVLLEEDKVAPGERFPLWE